MSRGLKRSGLEIWQLTRIAIVMMNFIIDEMLMGMEDVIRAE